MSVGFKTNFPKTVSTNFTVLNVAENNKTVKVFNYPILNGQTRDLLKIPEVSEADIQHSLLKGELKIKFECRELVVVNSNIQLIQFDDQQKEFLESIGITEGLEVTSAVGTIPFNFQQGIELLGTKNGVNRVFTTPDDFINGDFENNHFEICIKHNGHTLVLGQNFSISESGGVGTGFNTITFIDFAPASDSELFCSYVTEA